MALTDDQLSDAAQFHLKLIGDEIDRVGVNMHQLGRALIISQELVNVTAGELIKRKIPIDRYIREPTEKHYYRRYFFQGHIIDVNRGSFDIIIPLLAQPELRAFLTSEAFRAFAISVLANLFTSATYVLGGRWRSQQSLSDGSREAEHSLAIQLAPQLEKLARCLTPRGGIETMELTAEETKDGSWLHLRVERGSRERVLDFVESTPVSETSLAGEIRSIDLDRRRATLVESVTGNRIELDVFGDAQQLKDILGKSVEVHGKLEPVIDRRGGVRNQVKVQSITDLDKLPS